MMTIKKTLEILSEKCNKSKRQKYFGDAAVYSFYSHILKLLSKIAKQKIDEEVFIPQESGKQMFDCKLCDGDGYVESWENGDGKNTENKVIKDCDVCKGEGKVEIKVIDKRKKTKEKDLYYGDEY